MEGPQATEIDEQGDPLARDKEMTAFSTATQAATQQAVKQVEENRENPELADKIRNPDVDTPSFPGVEADMAGYLSTQLAFGNRDPDFEERSQLLGTNYAERVIIEKSPGRLLREHPLINAVFQGVDGPDDIHFTEPLKSGESRALYQAADVGANIRSLAVQGRGLDALMTATVENRNVKTESTEESTLKDRASALLA